VGALKGPILEEKGRRGHWAPHLLIEIVSGPLETRSTDTCYLAEFGCSRSNNMGAGRFDSKIPNTHAYYHRYKIAMYLESQTSSFLLSGYDDH